MQHDAEAYSLISVVRDEFAPLARWHLPPHGTWPCGGLELDRPLSRGVGDGVTLTLSELDRVVGGLPASAARHRGLVELDQRYSHACRSWPAMA
jgi:hypothetical protein